MEALRGDLKKLIVATCDKQVPAAEIGDKEPLFGPDARLRLDSLDALQLSVEIQKRYGIRLTDPKEVRRVFADVETLSAYVHQHRK
jgi:acyl carrier protein